MARGGRCVSEAMGTYEYSRDGYRARNVMMPRTGSYGETPTVTRSPGTTLMRKRRIRPLNCASTSCPASHCTRYNPPEWTATTVPCISIRSSLLNQLILFTKSSNECATRGSLAQVQCFPAFGDQSVGV